MRTDYINDQDHHDYHSPSPTCFVLRRWDGNGNEYAFSEKFYYNACQPYDCPHLPDRTAVIEATELTATVMIEGGLVQYAEIWHEAYGHRWLYDRLSDYYDRIAERWLTRSQRRHGYWHRREGDWYRFRLDPGIIFRCEPSQPHLIDESQRLLLTLLTDTQNRIRQAEIDQVRSAPRDEIDALIADTNNKET